MTCYDTQSYHIRTVSMTMKQVQVRIRAVSVNTFMKGG